jgi:two-component system sensor histidine kinase KdpD
MWRLERLADVRQRVRQFSTDWRFADALSATALLGGATIVMLAIRSHLNVLAVALTFLVLVTGIALFASRWTSVASSLAAFLLFNFFFVVPYYTLDVAAADHILALVVFLGVATLISQLIYRVRIRTVEALRRGRQMTILAELSQALIADVTVAGMLGAIVERAAEVLEMPSCAVLMLDPEGELVVQAAVGEFPPVEDRDHAAVAQWAIEQRRPAGIGQRPQKVVPPRGSRQQIPERRDASLYVPIGVATRVTGLLYISQAGNHRFTDEDQQILLTFANQIALALDRVRLGEALTQAAVIARSDELKSALLSAVSHDLRTPLASIKASVTSLLQPDITWSPDDERDLLVAINEETDRLARLVSNLLDLTRIEAGELRPQREWNDPEELLHETAQRAAAALPRHEIRLGLATALPPVLFDYIEIAQVLFNLIENAGKYAPPASVIDVSASTSDGVVTFEVADRGPGIPAGEEERIFEKFYRIARPGGPGGTGIGLSICRGIVEAHGGRIWAEPREGGGALLRFTLPLAAGVPGHDRLAA